MPEESTANEFQQKNGVVFKDTALLIRALTHPSYQNENSDRIAMDNQRLEFLGDAVLDFIAGELLYHQLPDAAEGRLTRLRAAMVRTETLAELALETDVDKVLLLGRGEEDNGGRQRQSNLCAAFEAVVGALYLDQGMEQAEAFVLPLFESRLATLMERESDKDPKSRLQEWTQQHLNKTPVYDVVSSTGADHDKTFVIAVYIDDKPLATGSGRNKRIAAQNAAREVLDNLETYFDVDSTA